MCPLSKRESEYPLMQKKSLCLQQGIQANMRWTLESFDHRFVSTLDSYPFCTPLLSAVGSVIKLNMILPSEAWQQVGDENWVIAGNCGLLLQEY